MRNKKRIETGLKYLAVAVIAATASAFFVLHRQADSHTNINTLPHPEKQQVGYKAEDRKKLEQIIHQGSKDD